jgi:hypothetical protein
MLMDIASLAIVAGGFFTAKQYGFKNYHGLSFMFLTFGMLLRLVGDILWYASLAVDNALPFPSYLDAIYLISYPFLFIGFYRELFFEKIKLKPRDLYLPLVLSVLLVAGTTYYGVYKIYSPENTYWQNFIGMAYGACDVALAILLSFMIMKANEYKKGKFSTSWFIIFIGLSLYLVADVIYYAYFERYESGELSNLDLIWSASYLLTAYGFWSVGNIIEEIQHGILKMIAPKP